MSVPAGARKVHPAALPGATQVEAASPLPSVPHPFDHADQSPKLKCDHPDSEPFEHVSTVYVPAPAGGAAASSTAIAATSTTAARPLGRRLASRTVTPRPTRTTSPWRTCRPGATATSWP